MTKKTDENFPATAFFAALDRRAVPADRDRVWRAEKADDSSSVASGSTVLTENGAKKPLRRRRIGLRQRFDEKKEWQNDPPKQQSTPSRVGREREERPKHTHREQPKSTERYAQEQNSALLGESVITVSAELSFLVVFSVSFGLRLVWCCVLCCP